MTDTKVNKQKNNFQDIYFLLGAGVRHSAHNKGHDEGGST